MRMYLSTAFICCCYIAVIMDFSLERLVCDYVKVFSFTFSIHDLQFFSLFIYFQVDKFLKEFEEISGSLNQPKDLAKHPCTALQYGIHSCNYKHLQNVLSDLGKKDNFGGMVREPREGAGLVWVCKQHRKHTHKNVTGPVNISKTV